VLHALDGAAMRVTPHAYQCIAALCAAGAALHVVATVRTPAASFLWSTTDAAKMRFHCVPLSLLRPFRHELVHTRGPQRSARATSHRGALRVLRRSV